MSELSRTHSGVARRTGELRRLLVSGPLTADGAMGTMLVRFLGEAGTLAHRCLDELNLSLPALVRDVHREYSRAGAQILGTNTFGANRTRLSAFGFGEKVRSINQAGVRIAREAARGVNDDFQPFIAGIVGPLGVRMEPLGSMSKDQARAVFREQIDALVQSGVDLLTFETFQDLEELHAGILAARESAGQEITVIAQVSVEEDGTLACGASTEEVTRLLDEWPVDVIGVNCSAGPAVVWETLQAMAGWTSKPLSAVPNAGLPVTAGGRLVYPCSPEYLARYAVRFHAAGARIIGGCCGTTPEHIRQIRRALGECDTRVERAPRITIHESSEPPYALEKIPLAQRSQLASKLASGEFVSIVEIVPPHGPDAAKEITAAIQCGDAGFDCIAVPDGPRASARMSAMALCQLIQQHAGIECVLHYSCRDRNVLALQGGLLGAHALGIHNVLCITGDPPGLGNYPDATGVYDVDSAGLTVLASRLNRGLDLGGRGLGSQTSLLVGVAVNPAAPDLAEELRRFERKVAAGADYAVTQPVFDPQTLEDFLKRIEPYKLPIIAGIWPLTSLRQAEFLVNELLLPVPETYVSRIRSALEKDGGGEAARAEGVAIAHELVDRIRGMVAGIQVSVPQGNHRVAMDVRALH